ncbi:MAG: 16S rRNA (cytidine(1402)-2'-O)-methyltransferase [Candidatus Taylorbacteria bacterium RIFOXYD2_FULL_36_9]|uniref:Ribosomal RNA small subunit methyltransferase I n=1 Tax=Candidatus Taylorbacteria bacterium RIFOXYD2_FULL_36_9 TaxID=1802338 RepID=A0A1G2PEG6_9BACT|nr:MAG: 16S rRNA (cytidine(1402)-2'-O)-methyltransferase [Candidatus Taylorbacteria bacterium RIFOXYD2_FULL_36_9]
MLKFYVIGTPIGNMEDITYRAVRILSEVDLILCEDTRVTKNLLNKYGIKKETLSFHSQSKLSKTDKVLELIKEGKTLALVSDAGTPTISDPGSILVSKIKISFSEVEIIAVPGASAVTSALSISGLPASDFTFLGFLPHKKGRETLFKEIAESERTVVFYESPHRILKALDSLQKFAPEKKVVIARELTKVFEQVVSGHPFDVSKYFADNPDKVRGEFVVLVSPP